MANCIFCKIIAGEIPSVKIWEDDEFVAILDAFPNTRWMTLVLPKRHFDSDIFVTMDDEFYQKYLLAVKHVVALLKRWLNVNRVAMVMEGMWVDHAHIKLYPLYGVDAQRKEYRAKEPLYFDQYAGYISTQLGPKADMQDLQKIAEEISAATM